MSSMSVDGLISGLNTTQLIASLMQVEAQPQQNLKNQLATEQTAVSAYQSINTKMSALMTAADALTQNTTWQSLKVDSSSASVSASATTANTSGQLAFDVLSVAAAHSVRTDEVTGTDATVATTAGIDIVQGSGSSAVTTHIDLTDTSLTGVVNAINAKGIGVTAAAVQVRDGVYRLQLTATKTGAASAFTVSGLTPASAVATQGADAAISVGSGAGAYQVTSSTNTFSGVLPGVTFTVSKVESGVTLTSTVDGNTIADKVQAMVDAANAGLTEIGNQSAYNTSTNQGGPLTGDFTVRQLGQDISSSLYNALGPDGSLSQVGLQLDRDGKYTFDRDAFLAQYQADPAKAQRLVSGLATQLNTVSDDATNSTTGSITTAINGRNTEIDNLNNGIADWDTRLADRQDALKRQYAALEVTLGQLQSQSSWLSGQLAGLPSG